MLRWMRFRYVIATQKVGSKKYKQVEIQKKPGKAVDGVP